MTEKATASLKTYFSVFMPAGSMFVFNPQSFMDFYQRHTSEASQNSRDECYVRNNGSDLELEEHGVLGSWWLSGEAGHFGRYVTLYFNRDVELDQCPELQHVRKTYTSVDGRRKLTEREVQHAAITAGKLREIVSPHLQELKAAERRLKADPEVGRLIRNQGSLEDTLAEMVEKYPPIKDRINQPGEVQTDPDVAYFEGTLKTRLETVLKYAAGVREEYS